MVPSKRQICKKKKGGGGGQRATHQKAKPHVNTYNESSLLQPPCYQVQEIDELAKNNALCRRITLSEGIKFFQ